MRSVFADTFYFLALVNANDEFHARAVAFSGEAGVHLFTTAWVLTEVADGLASTHGRSVVEDLVTDLRQDPLVTFVVGDSTLWARGLSLYGSRMDKQWSLTDCISFVVMQDNAIMDALTGDHHFEQAGFQILLK